MKTLSETWFAEGYIDFELKKYTLLAYLQEVSKYFTQNKLYPQLGDLVFHYNNIVAFKENKRYLQEHFPKTLTGIQMEKLQLLYKQMIEDDELMQELESIINYSAGEMKNAISSGSEIYKFVENNISISPIGLIPPEHSEGYFLLNEGSNNTTHVYQYRLSFFEKNEDKYRTIVTEYVNSWERNMANTYENIKASLIETNKSLPNPAVYSIETDLNYPLEETLLPIAKRTLVRFISKPA